VEPDTSEQMLTAQLGELAIQGPLAVVDTEVAVYVVQAEDREDWIVRFTKDGQFPAAEWAHHMVAVYNDRLRIDGGGGAQRFVARPPGIHLNA